MTDNINSGDYIIDNYGIYEVTAIEDLLIKGKNEIYLYYKPLASADKEYVAHIPLENLKKAGLRKVLTKDQIKTIKTSISKNNISYKYDINLAKEAIYQNAPINMIPLMNYIWVNQESLSKAEKELMWKMLDNISKEVSFVTGNKYSAVRQDLAKKLEQLAKLVKE